jgi:hypothetical protein
MEKNMLNERTIKELRQKKKSPKVILKFVPTPNFEEEFLEFIEEILSWEKNSNENEKAENQQ